MAITRWNPVTLSPVRDLFVSHDEFSRLFDSIFTGSQLRGDLAPMFTPAVDIEETADEFVFKVDLPGMSKREGGVSLMGDTLTIRAGRKQRSEPKEYGMHVPKWINGTSERSS